MSTRNDVDIQIRKLRKKLRQIENLERLDRELTEEESDKVFKKYEIRRVLLELISQQGPEEDEQSEMSHDQSHDSAYTEEDSNISAPERDFYKKCEIEKEEESIEYVEDEDADEEDDEREVSEPQETEKKDIILPFVESVKTASGATNIKHEKSEPKKHEQIRKPVVAQVAPRRGQGDGAPNKKAKKDSSRPGGDLARQWRSLSFSVKTLEGHNDVIRCTDTDGKLLISAGSDTMIKVWSLHSGLEQRSFGGHTGSVTSVVLLSQSASQTVGEACGLGRNDRIVVSGSQDCSLRIWSVDTGTMVRSIYTYSPVTCLKYLEDPGLLVSGSGGGKLELWSPVTGDNVQSFVAHEDGISVIQVHEKWVYTACVDGLIKVFELRENQLHTMFVSENVKSVTGGELLRRHIRCMGFANQKLFYGDDGMNVKVLDWKLGEVHKLTNHTNEFGTTDSMFCFSDLLLSSGYDLDNGVGYVNVRSLPNEHYLCTLCDDDTQRIVSLSAHHDNSGKLHIITAGPELKIWTQLGGKQSSDSELPIVPADFDSRFERPARNSDLDSESELSDSDIEERGPYIPAVRRLSSSEDGETKGWFSWCNLL